MVFSAINAITAVIGLVFLFNGYYLVRKGREDIAVFLMSGLIGLGLIVVAAFPTLFDFIADILGIEFKTNAILIVASLTLFILVTFLFNRIGHLNKNISRLNEELSLLRNQVEEGDDG